LPLPASLTGLPKPMKILKHKKKYYTPGLISSAILSVVFYMVIMSATKPSGVRCIRVFFPDTAYLRRQNASTGIKEEIPPKRNYTDIMFTGTLETDKIKLAFAQVRIREIIKTNDTLNGVHFLFSDSANYGTFVVVINMLNNENAKRWLPVDNHLWYFEYSQEL
jgi:hypothetical protein